MKMNRRMMLAAVLLMAGGTSYAQETEVPAAEAAGILSDDWKDYQIQIDDQVYQFPMAYDDFTALGWSADESDLSRLEPNQYTLVRLKKDKVKAAVYVLNLGLNTLPAEECIVGGMDIDSYDWNLEESSITLPGGIVRGEADVASIEAAYGTPSDTYESDLYNLISYETDYNSSVEMRVYKESGVLESIDIRNFVEPEDFDAGEASEEVPADILAYAKPEALGDDLSEYQIEVEGEAYSLPVPVSVLAADGWEVDERNSDSTIKARSSGWVTLRKGGQEIHKMAYNAEHYATIPENCWIEEIEIGEYQTNVDGRLPGGIATGMAETDFLAVLDGAGVAYEMDESGDYKYYKYSNPEYGCDYEVTVYDGDNGYFEKNTIMEISCSNLAE